MGLLIFYSTASFASAVYYRLCLKKHTGHVDASVALILPLTGRHDSFQKLLGLLEQQTLRPKRLIIAIESDTDPAYPFALSLASSVSFPVSVVIAGLAESSSQKCHNLVAAARQLDAGEDYVVMLDADIAPPEWWLAAVIKPLARKQYDIVSGYRWQVPAGNSFAENLISFIDRAIALSVRPPGLTLLWGGTLALPVQLLRKTLADRVLENTVSDDLMLAEYATKNNYRVLNRRVLLVPSRPPAGLLQVWNFAVRQLQIIKIYRPGLWLIEFVRITLLIACWLVMFTCSDNRIILYSSIAIVFSLLCMKHIVSLSIASCLGYRDRPDVRLSQFGLVFCRPLIDLFMFMVLFRSLCKREVQWSHVTYLVTAPNVVKIKTRKAC